MSSKKQFDYIEEKIRQAADNSLPAFDEKAWLSLKAKLDGDNKKRRPVLWWIVLPLALAGVWGVYYNITEKDKVKNKEIVTVKDSKNQSVNKSDAIRDASKNNKTERDKNNLPAALDAPTDKTENGVIENKPPETASNYLEPVTTVNKPLSIKKTRLAANKKGKLKTAINKAEPYSEYNTDTALKENATEKETGIVTEINSNEEKSNKDAPLPQPNNENAIPEEITVKGEVRKKEQNKQEDKPAIIKKDKKKLIVKGLYLIAAGGADAGSTRLLSFANNKITPKYGVGIGYQFNKRWSVQSGLYATSKKYVANIKDYNIKPGSPMASYPIEKIRTTCQVIEIPLSVRYNILNKSSFTLYTTAGVASYIMQKENYDCYYRYYNNTYEYEWSFSGNRHLFSTAIFSFGFEKPLSAKFSLLAEPSISIPLSGVGEGKMNIYSSSALLGIRYFPFK